MNSIKLSLILFFLFINVCSAQIKEYYISCDPADFALIYENYEEDIYIPATVTYEGQIWEDTRMRIRGDGSRIYKKKSLKIKFDGDLFYTGRETLNLNADISDKSYMHTYLSSLLFNQTGYPCFESEHVKLYLNGEYLGLYIQIENMDEDFLKARGLDPNGNLYKATVDGASLRLPDEVDFYWEKKTNTNSDMSDLRELIEEINSVPNEKFYDFMINTFDYDNVITNLAMNILIANSSTYYHNYYMYHDINNTGKWMTFPWDLDKTISHYGYGLYFTVTPGAWAHDNPLIKRSLICEPVFNDIKLKLAELSGSIFNEDELFPVIDSLRNVLEEPILADTTDNIEVLSDWEGLIAADKEFISLRYSQVLSQFDEHPDLFEVNTTRDIETGDILLTWHPSSGKQDREISYVINYGPKPHYDVEGSVQITDIKDTFYVLKASDLSEGKYYWQVRVFDGKYWVTGFDHHNTFEYKKGTTLPCDINEDMTLTEAGSPYLVECNVTVAKNADITVNPGVEIRISDSCDINVEGSIKCKGSSESPVIIYTGENCGSWGFVNLNIPADSCYFNHTEFYNTKLYSWGGHFSFNNVKMINETVQLGDASFVWLEGGYGTISNSLFMADSATSLYGSSEGIFFKQASGIVDNCEFRYIPDVIEVSLSDDVVITNNLIHYSPDDGIDINFSHDVLIESNRIFNTYDKGISIGGASDHICSNINIRKNIIAGCHIAVGAKEYSNINFVNNTLYNNNIAYQATGNNITNSVNNIFSESSEDSTFNIESGADVSFSYCLCDNLELEGEGNLFEGPLLVSPENNNFGLTAGSPCINAGDPASANDPDGSRADIGAKFFNLNVSAIVINEINYHSPDDFDAGDWVELYNPNETDQDISGWMLMDDDNSHIYTFAENTVINAWDYLVICNDTAKFKTIHAEATKFCGNTAFGLGGNGDQVRLFNKSGILIDSVEYDDKEPWPVEPDGNGPTLELISPEFDNALAESWSNSYNHGTPGKINDSHDSSYRTLPKENLEAMVFPNPMANFSRIEFLLTKNSYVSISIFDESGRELKKVLSEKLMNAGKRTVNIYRGNLHPGVYYCRLSTETSTNVVPMVVLPE